MSENKYETMVVFSVAEGDESAQPLVEKFKAMIEATALSRALMSGASASSRIPSMMSPRDTM